MLDVSAIRSFQDVPYPFQERWMTIDGMRVCYVDEGAGPPLVFLPPVSRSLKHYELNYPSFVGRYRVLGLDLPGAGKSDKPQDRSYDVRSHVDIVARWLGQLGLPPVALVGNSLGGLLALELTLRQPASVRGLFLAAPAGHPPGLLRTLYGRFYLDPRRYQGMEAAAWRGLIARNFASAPAEVEEAVALATALAKAPEFPDYCAAMVKGMKSALMTDVLPRARAIQAPTRILWGREDRVFPANWLPDFLAAIPSAQGEVLDGCGHYPNIERPGAFNRALDAFLARLPA